MKFRTRLMALCLTVLLTAQLPLTAFANTTTQEQGQVVVINEDGQQQVITAEQLASGEGLPENLIVNEESVQTSTQSESAASESTQASSDASANTQALAESAAASESASVPAESVSGAASAPAVSDSTPAESGEESMDSGLPVEQTADTAQSAAGQTGSADASGSSAAAQSAASDSATTESAAVDSAATEPAASVPAVTEPAASESVPSEEEEKKEEVLPYIYWNPGQGYEVEPSHLETPKAESESTSESTAASSSTPESIPAASSASESVPASSGTTESAPASGSTPESAPASSSTPESTPAASGTTESAPASSSETESAPASSSTTESAPASSGTTESAPASSSETESAPASSGVTESAPAASSTPESAPAASSPAESAPMPENTVAAEPAAQPSHEATAEAGFAEQAGQVLNNLNPVQTAHAADTLEPEQEKGFFAGILDWISWIFSPVIRFFQDLAAFAMTSNEVPAGDDANTGRSPLTPVKSFDAALQRARELSAELGITMDQVTIYMMNPLEIATGQNVEINTDMAILKAWEGRNYDSDMLFYLTGGTLSLRNTVLTPRAIDPAKMQDAGKSLVWLYGGAVVLENNVSAYGGFVLDFYQEEAARLWNAQAALAADKTEIPVIRLGESFAPVGMGYSIQLRAENSGADQLELVQAPYLDELKMEEYAASFAVVGDTADEWTYEVMGKQEEPAPMARARARAAVQDSGKSPVSASLYAVRASDGVKIYWNPGQAVEGAPAGNDSNTGLALTAPVKTWAKAMSQAQANGTTTIVCMQTINLSDENAKEYLTYDAASEQYRLHGTDLGDKRFTVENWLTHEVPVVEVTAGTTLSVQNVNLSSASGTTTLHSGTAVLRQSGVTNEAGTVTGGKIILQDRVQISQGYIEMVFEPLGATPETRGYPSAIEVRGMDVSANIFGANLNTLLQARYTPLVEASQTLIDKFTAADGKTKEQLAGEHLLANFHMEKANSLLPEDGGVSDYSWNIRMGDGKYNDVMGNLQKFSVLYLYTDLKYNGIYINSDPAIGSDDNYGATCEYPVATLGMALQRFEEAVTSAVEARTEMKAAGATREERDKLHPIPQVLWACTPVEVNSEQSWDWTKYQSHVDEDGQPITMTLQPHYEPTPTAGQPDGLHALPGAAVKVGAGGNLTIGNGVRIGLYFPFDKSYGAVGDSKFLLKQGNWIANFQAVRVLDGGSLTVTGSAELIGSSNVKLSESETNQYNMWMQYPGVGIAVGVNNAYTATMIYEDNSFVRYPATAGTVTLDAAWTGSIHGFGRGVLVEGSQAKLTMNGGTIEGNKNTYEGGGVSVYTGALFEMNGGTISNNQVEYAGGGVYVDGSNSAGPQNSRFYFNDGLITGNMVAVGTIGALGYLYISPDGTQLGVPWLWSTRQDNAQANSQIFPLGGAGVYMYGGTITMGNTGGSPRIEGNSIQKKQSLTSDLDGHYVMGGAGLCGTGKGISFIEHPTLEFNAYLKSGTISGNFYKDAPDAQMSDYNQSVNLLGLGAALLSGKQIEVGAVTIENNELRYVNNTATTMFGGETFALGTKVYGIGLYLYLEGTNCAVDGVQLRNNKMLRNSVKSYAQANEYIIHDFMGGGLAVRTDSRRNISFKMQNAVVTGNEMLNGAGIAIASEAESDVAVNFVFTDFTIENNTAFSEPVEGTETTIGGTGGAFYSQDGPSILKNITLQSNTAENGGAVGLLGAYSNTLFQDCTITGNTANQNGGGIYTEGGDITLRESTPNQASVSGNTAGKGGAIYILNGASVYLMLEQTWKNTAGEGSNVYIEGKAYGYADLFLLKGTFEGENSIVAANETSRQPDRIGLDMRYVKFTALEEGKSHIYSKSADNRLMLLQRPAQKLDTPLRFSVAPGKAEAGTVLVEAGVPGLYAAPELDIPVIQMDQTDPAQWTQGAETMTFNPPVLDPSQGWQEWLELGDLGMVRATLAGVERETYNKIVTDLAVVAEGVYVNGASGSDANNGTSPDRAVQSFKKAKELLAQYTQNPDDADGFQPIIYVCGTISINSSNIAQNTENGVMSLPSSQFMTERYIQAEQAAGREPQKAMLQRYLVLQSEPMISVNGNGTEDGVVLSLENLRLDGNGSKMSLLDGTSILEIENKATVKLGNGVRLFNPNKNGRAVWVDAGKLEMNQTFAPGDVDEVYDEKYGVQIEVPAEGIGIGMAGNSWDGINRGTLIMSGYAVISGPEGTAVECNAHANVYMQDNALITGYRGVSAPYDTSGNVQSLRLDMKGNAKIECTDYAVHNWKSQISKTWDTDKNEIIMADQSVIKGGTSLNYFEETGGAIDWQGGALDITMTGTSKIDGKIGKSFTDPWTGSYLRIQMGRENVMEDAPVINCGQLRMGAGLYYLEMNGSSKLPAGVEIYGLNEPYGNYKPFATNGILVRDQAQIQPTLGTTTNNFTGITIRVQQSFTWDQQRPFSIIFEEDAKLSFLYDGQNTDNPAGYHNYWGVRVTTGTTLMAPTQGIYFKGNAKMENFPMGGAIFGDVTDGVYQLGRIEISDQAEFIPDTTYADLSMEEYTKWPNLSADTVVIAGSPKIPLSANTYHDPTKWGSGVGITARDITVSGTAQIGGAIQLAQTFTGGSGSVPVKLTSAPTGGPGQFKLQVNDNYLGDPVVVPAGSLSDVSGYLSYFEKTVGYGETKDVPLAAQKPNIILQAEFNVYLSTNGSDMNDGTTPAKAVRTFQKAKEILQTKPGYGEGSDIIIPDNVDIQQGDTEWSFDDGGFLTNSATKETWQPLVRRAMGTTYTYPMISVMEDGVDLRVTNVTIDAGGSDVSFDLSYNSKDIYYDSYGVVTGKESAFHAAKRKYAASVFAVSTVNAYNEWVPTEDCPTLYLGENTVIQNLDYTMVYNGDATKRVPTGFAIGADRAEVTIDGAEIKDFHIRSYSHPSPEERYGNSGPRYSGDSVVACIVVKARSTGETAADGSLTILGGSIHDNSIEITGQKQSLYPTDPTAILATNANFEMSGGEIYNNVITATNWEKPGVSQKDTGEYAVASILAFGSWGINRPIAHPAVISGGSIHDNVNEIGLKADTAMGGKTVLSVESIIALGSNATDAANKGTPTLTVTGGSIQNNQARHGSAFYVANGTLTLKGGSISGNHNPNALKGTEDWKPEYSPIYVRADRGYTQFVLEGSGCVMDDSVYLERGTGDVGATAIVSKEMTNTTRVYKLYVDNARQGDVVVQPDGVGLASVTSYLANFEIHAENLMGDIGTTSTMRDVNGPLSGTNQMPESSCLLLFKPVFVDGESGQDPGDIQVETGVVTNGAGEQDILLGFDPDHPVKTFDAAKLLGQSVQSQHSALGWEAHKPRKDCYIIVSLGEMNNELYQGTETLPADGSVPAPNEDAANMTFSLSGAARILRYTNFLLHLGNDQHAGGTEESMKKWYQYDGIFRFANPGAVVLQDLTVYGRRTTDNNTNYGEALVQVASGVNLTVKTGVTLALNNANGTRPGLDGLPENIDARGGALRVESGATATIESVTIENTEAVYGGAIYVEGGTTPGELTVTGTVSIGASVYLAGGKDQGSHIRVTKDFSPGATALSLELEVPYSGRMIVEHIDGTTASIERQNLFALSQSVTGMYEVIVQGTSNEQMVISQRSVFFLDPTAAENGDGLTPETAFNSLNALYQALDDPQYDSLTGILTYVINTIEIPAGQTVSITNARYTVNEINHYYSYYQPSTGNSITLNCQIYFKRYVQPTVEGQVPTGYNKPTFLGELFNIQGTLKLNGIYLDGHSIELTDEAGRLFPATQAEAPLVRVQGTGQLVCDTQGIQLNGQNCTVDSTLFSNNVNNKRKTAIVPGTTDVIEGSSAGLEVLATATEVGHAELKNTRFTGLSLGTDGGAPVIGGSDIYLNGTMNMSENMFMEGTVYLEGHGYAGDSAEAQTARESSRWINISAWGSPARSPFTIVMRDAYTGRFVVRYPKSDSGSMIPQDDIAKYKLHDDVTRYYTFQEEVLTQADDPMNNVSGAQVLTLIAPKAVYLDPVNGTTLSDANQQSVGFTPSSAVKTLDDAFKQLKAVSGKVLYVMNTVEVNSYVKINNEYYENADGTREVMPNSGYITIRRFVTPEQAASLTGYNEPTFDGALFSVVGGGELVLSGNVEVAGHSKDIGYGDEANHVPVEQQARGVQSAAPLIVVNQSGTVRIEDDPNATSGAALINNANTKETAGVTPLNGGALCILEGGEAQISGGSIRDNTARVVPASQAGGQPGAANGVYNEGRLVVYEPASGISQNQDIALNGEGIISMYTMLTLEDVASYQVSIMNPSVGRVVAKYTGYIGVDSDASRYIMDDTLPSNLFLVESATDSSVLELQDWKVLNVSLPEEIFLGVYQTSGAESGVSRVDVDGKDYATATYEITNNGAYTANIYLSGFVQNAWQGSAQGDPSMQLAADPSELTSTNPLLYLAVEASGETQASGNQFADLVHSPLKKLNLLDESTQVNLGKLGPTQSGSFSFVGQANTAFIDAWMDTLFPSGDAITADDRRNHMRTKDDLTGETTLNNAAAQFTLHYRIELDRTDAASTP